MAQNYVVEQRIFNHFGTCSDELPTGDNPPGANFIAGGSDQTFEFTVYKDLPTGTYYSNGAPRTKRVSHTLKYSAAEALLNYFQQNNDIPDDVELNLLSFLPSQYPRQSTGGRFDTLEEAEEFIDEYTFEPLTYVRDGLVIANASYSGITEGYGWTQGYAITYSGDTLRLYTFNDWINFWADIFGTDGNPFTFVSYKYTPLEGDTIDIPEDEIDDHWPGFDCQIGRTARIIELNNGSTIHDVTIDYQPLGPDPTNVTVTTVITDGDPPLTELENGPGSITVSDNGNILMLNDGGTFFLNEFGNVGFYANGDASLTADNQVQLGVGQNSVTVENGSLTIRDETGSATLTAEDINRLKETLT